MHTHTDANHKTISCVSTNQLTPPACSLRKADQDSEGSGDASRPKRRRTSLRARSQTDPTDLERNSEIEVT